MSQISGLTTHYEQPINQTHAHTNTYLLNAHISKTSILLSVYYNTQYLCCPP